MNNLQRNLTTHHKHGVLNKAQECQCVSDQCEKAKEMSFPYAEKYSG